MYYNHNAASENAAAYLASGDPADVLRSFVQDVHTRQLRSYPSVPDSVLPMVVAQDLLRRPQSPLTLDLVALDFCHPAAARAMDLYRAAPEFTSRYKVKAKLQTLLHDLKIILQSAVSMMTRCALAAVDLFQAQMLPIIASSFCWASKPSSYIRCKQVVWNTIGHLAFGPQSTAAAEYVMEATRQALEVGVVFGRVGLKETRVASQTATPVVGSLVESLGTCGGPSVKKNWASRPFTKANKKMRVSEALFRFQSLFAPHRFCDAIRRAVCVGWQ